MQAMRYHLLLLLLMLPMCLSGSQVDDVGHYTNDFAVEMDGDMEEADLIAGIHGFTLMRQIPSLGNVYHFIHEHTERRSKRSADHLVQLLSKDPNVHRVEQQQVLGRVKRRIVHDKQSELPINLDLDQSIYERHFPEEKSQGDPGQRMEKDNIPEASWTNVMGFNDPHFRDQWYFDNKGQTGGKVGMDVDVIAVWKKGLTGKGVVVTILDDGVDHTHPDLRDNYDAEASTDLNDRNDSDPRPDDTRESNSHGTRCAGEIAAKANNNNCGVGIAHNARIGGVRMLDGVVTDLLEAEAISFKRDYIDIYSASWGPSDNGKTLEGPGSYCRRALEDGVKLGRQGKGSIFVWATGNGGMNDDDCSCDGYVSSIETLSIGSISDQGLSTYFSEVCPSTMAVIVTGGSHSPPGQRDYTNPKIKVVTTDLHGKCTLEFQGTSAAAPLAAGCFALVLEANPDLTWRDMQHLVVHTARIPNADEDGWTINGGGFHVNHHFGFGALDCGRMVEAAQGWISVGEQKRCEVTGSTTDRDINMSDPLSVQVQVEGCSEEHRVTSLEHVQLHISLEHERRGDLTILLTSPSGTQSTILSPRLLDDDSSGINFSFMTVHNWGEDPRGEWTLDIRDMPHTGYNSVQRGVLHAWSMTLWGTDGIKTQQQMESGSGPAHEAREKEVNHVMNEEKADSEGLDISYHQEKRQQLDDVLTQLIEALKDNTHDAEPPINQLHVSKKNTVDSEHYGSVGSYGEELRGEGVFKKDVHRELSELANDLGEILHELEKQT